MKGGVKMTDEKIIELFWNRDQAAIKETENKYKRYLYKIALNFLRNKEDIEESLNDTYLKAWDSIPPQRPQYFSLYLAKILRERAIDVLRKNEAAKRKTSNFSKSLDELGEFISGNNTAFSDIEAKELGEKINIFLSELSPVNRGVFIMRYFYCEPIKVISSHFGLSISNTKTTLHRIRLELKAYLESEGYEI